MKFLYTIPSHIHTFNATKNELKCKEQTKTKVCSGFEFSFIFLQVINFGIKLLSIFDAKSEILSKNMYSHGNKHYGNGVTLKEQNLS